MEGLHNDPCSASDVQAALPVQPRPISMVSQLLYHAAEKLPDFTHAIALASRGAWSYQERVSLLVATSSKAVSVCITLLAKKPTL